MILCTLDKGVIFQLLDVLNRWFESKVFILKLRINLKCGLIELASRTTMDGEDGRSAKRVPLVIPLVLRAGCIKRTEQREEELKIQIMSAGHRMSRKARHAEFQKKFPDSVLWVCQEEQKKWSPEETVGPYYLESAHPPLAKLGAASENDENKELLTGKSDFGDLGSDERLRKGDDDDHEGSGDRGKDEERWKKKRTLNENRRRRPQLKHNSCLVKKSEIHKLSRTQQGGGGGGGFRHRRSHWKGLKEEVIRLRTQTARLEEELKIQSRRHVEQELKIKVVNQLFSHQLNKLDSAELTCPTQLIPYRYTASGFPLMCVRSQCKGVMSHLGFQGMCKSSINGVFCTTCQSITEDDTNKEGIFPNHSLALSAEMYYVFKVIEFNAIPLVRLSALKTQGELDDVAGFTINWDENDILGKTQPAQFPTPYFKSSDDKNVSSIEEQFDRVKTLIAKLPLLEYHADYRIDGPLLCALLEIAGHTFREYLADSESNFPAELLEKMHVYEVTGKGGGGQEIFQQQEPRITVVNRDNSRLLVSHQHGRHQREQRPHQSRYQHQYRRQQESRYSVINLVSSSSEGSADYQISPTRNNYISE